ncbi:MAG: hypothetical protein AAGU05_00680 [Anaerolineaceae bacterium]
MDFSEERNMILDMVAEGRISVEDAKQLLDALEKSARKQKQTDDDFFVTPGMDFHVPEVRVPNVGRIVRHAIRGSMPGYRFNSEEADEIRENLEEELETLREEMETLREQARNITEELKEQARDQAREHRRRGEDWE